jgi:uncharacterized cupredoxin-like copper-binding protein
MFITGRWGMKRKVMIKLSMAICLLFLISLILPVHSSEAQQTHGKLSGKVIQIIKKTKSMTVLGMEGGMSFEAAKAKFKGYRSFKEVKQGDEVTVEFTMKQGKAIAHTIEKK